MNIEIIKRVMAQDEKKVELDSLLDLFSQIKKKSPQTSEAAFVENVSQIDPFLLQSVINYINTEAKDDITEFLMNICSYNRHHFPHQENKFIEIEQQLLEHLADSLQAPSWKIVDLMTKLITNLIESGQGNIPISQTIVHKLIEVMYKKEPKFFMFSQMIGLKTLGAIRLSLAFDLNLVYDEQVADFHTKLKEMNLSVAERLPQEILLVKLGQMKMALEPFEVVDIPQQCG